jgi:hypothetical protein
VGVGGAVQTSPTTSQPRSQATSPTKAGKGRRATSRPPSAEKPSEESGVASGAGSESGVGVTATEGEQSGMFPERAEFGAAVMTTGGVRSNVMGGSPRPRRRPNSGVKAQAPAAAPVPSSSGANEEPSESGAPVPLRTFAVTVIQQLRVQSADMVFEAAQAAQVWAAPTCPTPSP